MKKRFYSKKNKKKKGVKRIILLLIFVLSLYISYQILDERNKKIDQKELVQLLLSPKKETNIIKQIISLFIPTKEETIKTMLDTTYKGLIEEEQTIPVTKEEKTPLIYIYNSHQTEEYTPSSFVEYINRKKAADTTEA